MYSSSLTLRWNEDRYMGVMLRYGVNAHPIFNASDFVHFLPSGPLDYHHHRWMNTLGEISKNDWSYEFLCSTDTETWNNWYTFIQYFNTLQELVLILQTCDTMSNCYILIKKSIKLQHIPEKKQQNGCWLYGHSLGAMLPSIGAWVRVLALLSEKTVAKGRYRKHMCRSLSHPSLPLQ